MTLSEASIRGLRGEGCVAGAQSCVERRRGHRGTGLESSASLLLGFGETSLRATAQLSSTCVSPDGTDRPPLLPQSCRSPGPGSAGAWSSVPQPWRVSVCRDQRGLRRASVPGAAPFPVSTGAGLGVLEGPQAVNSRPEPKPAPAQPVMEKPVLPG